MMNLLIWTRAGDQEKNVRLSTKTTSHCRIKIQAWICLVDHFPIAGNLKMITGTVR